jgi:2-polyprenyl-6-methoxyphenol hydroxylase-like FAD-dependent oxidoreductase
MAPIALSDVEGPPAGGPPAMEPPKMPNMMPPLPPTTWEKHQIVVAGGGPVGLWLALNLAQKGIEVLVLESEQELSQSPRALLYMPIVLNEFDKAGILDSVLEAGHKNTDGLCFRSPASTGDSVHAYIKSSQKPPQGAKSADKINFAGLQLGQGKLARIILEHASKLPNFSIKFGHRITGVKEINNQVRVLTSTSEGEKFFEADFVVGCDGASSAVRRSLCIPFEGFTWDDFRFVAINIFYDFEKHGSYPAANHVVDADDWAVIARAGPKEEGLWRVSTGMPASWSLEEVHQKIPEKLERLLPGPRPLDYKIDAVNPYFAHERVAASYREGRVVLCGDAAHVNNPLAGLGLTTGLLDVPVLTKALATAFETPEAWEASLEEYATGRREAFVKYTQQEAILGKLRIHSMKPEIIKQRQGFFYMLNNDPGFQQMIASEMAKVVST